MGRTTDRIRRALQVPTLWGNRKRDYEGSGHQQVPSTRTKATPYRHYNQFSPEKDWRWRKVQVGTKAAGASVNSDRVRVALTSHADTATAAAYTPINQNRARENASRGIKRTIVPQQLNDYTARLYQQSADPSRKVYGRFLCTALGITESISEEGIMDALNQAHIASDEYYSLANTYNIRVPSISRGWRPSVMAGVRAWLHPNVQNQTKYVGSQSLIGWEGETYLRWPGR